MFSTINVFEQGEFDHYFEKGKARSELNQSLRDS